MFSFVINHLLHIGVAVAFAVMLYMAFVSDWVNARKREKNDVQLREDNAAKLTRVKLVSDDVKDIEQFITQNARYLTHENVKKLVERIEAIKNDGLISGDALKAKIDKLVE